MKKHLWMFFFSVLLFSCDQEEVVPPAPEFTIRGPYGSDEDTFFAVGEPMTLTDVSKATTYSWDFGDGTRSHLRAPDSHFYQEAGIYTVKLVTSINGKESSTEKEVKVGRYYAYEVQLLNFVDNMWLEGGDAEDPSVEEAPDIYLQIMDYSSEPFKTVYESDVISDVKKENLPLSWEIEPLVLSGSHIDNGFHFFDRNENSDDRLISTTHIGGVSSHGAYDGEKEEGYFTGERGTTPGWGFKVLVKYRLQLP